MKIAEDVLTVLNNSRLENNVLYLPPTQLERKLYVSTNKVLELLGGKWNKKIKGHTFDSDVDELLNDAINFGEITDHKKEYQFFPTPKEIVSLMIGFAEIKNSDTILEPSAGDGAIANELISITPNIHIVELNPKMFDLLKDFPVRLNEDFLTAKLEPVYDKVVMNPPFSKQQDVDHILKAFSLLKPGGILVSVVSESPFFRQNKKSIEFREWLDINNAEIFELESGAFKSSGTMVKSRIIKTVK